MRGARAEEEGNDEKYQEPFLFNKRFFNSCFVRRELEHKELRSNSSYCISL